MAGVGIDDVTEHYAKIIEDLGEKPIVGHSFGGMIAEKLLGLDLVASTAETDLLEFADHGHSLTIDSGWREIADASLRLLNEHGR
jgi:hypothetical protein